MSAGVGGGWGKHLTLRVCGCLLLPVVQAEFLIFASHKRGKKIWNLDHYSTNSQFIDDKLMMEVYGHVIISA